MSPLQSIYNHLFYKNLICPEGITYIPCPESCRGFVFLTDIISGLSNYNEQNYHLQILIEGVKGNDAREGGLLSNHFDSSKRHYNFQFQIKWAHLKFLQPLIP